MNTLIVLLGRECSFLLDQLEVFYRRVPLADATTAAGEGSENQRTLYTPDAEMLQRDADVEAQHQQHDDADEAYQQRHHGTEAGYSALVLRVLPQRKPKA